MIALAWVLGSIATYTAIGFWVAAWDMDQLHQRIKDSSEYSTRSWQKRAEAARETAWMTAIFWPVRGPYVVMARLADKHNPDLIRREIARVEEALADREREIVDLERRMKIGKDIPVPTLDDLRPGWNDGRYEHE